MGMSSFLSLRHSTSQNVAVGAASATVTNAFGSQTYCVRISTTGACHFRIVEAAGGTALATDPLLPTNWVDYITVSPGQKIAVIQDGTSTGNLNVTEMV
jgi:hypothetical protein